MPNPNESCKECEQRRDRERELDWEYDPKDELDWKFDPEDEDPQTAAMFAVRAPLEEAEARLSAKLNEFGREDLRVLAETRAAIAAKMLNLVPDSEFERLVLQAISAWTTSKFDTLEIERTPFDRTKWYYR